MSDIVMSKPVLVVGTGLAAAGLTWFLMRRQTETNHVEQIATWTQVAPAGAKTVTVKEFGETELQAQLVTSRYSTRAMRQRSTAFLNMLSTRRTMRFYSTDDIPQDVLETCLRTAGTSPSGAHHQPWFFAVVRDHEMKSKIRQLVEAEEKVNYERRMRKSWVEDLSSMTGEKSDERLRSSDGAPQKPYLTEAPAIIVMFKQTHTKDADGKRVDNYYVNESCGIAAGVLLTALHNVGLASLTSTPMGAEQAIREMLGRPENEKLFLLLPVGFPAKDATVPFRTPLRKGVNELCATF